MRPTIQPDANHLTRRIREMISGGRVHAARPLLGALRKLSPPTAELAELEARLLLREGRLEAALEQLDAAISSAPETLGLRICRADARMQANNIIGAAADAADAVILEPSNAQAKAMLGAILIEMDRPQDALPCLREAVAAEPRRTSYRQALATAQERTGDRMAAATTLDDGIRSNAGDVGLRTAAIMVALRDRSYERAFDLAEAARRDGVADACVFGLQGHALSSLGRHEQAGEAYAEALKLAPEDPYVRHLVAASGIGPQASRAPSEYLETVFDGYAQRFESHLIGLGYRVPGLIRAALMQSLAVMPGASPIGPVLDLGCGTGLMSVVLSDLPLGPWTGVDLSTGMLAEARSKGLYDTLIHADLEQMLAQSDEMWPLILAADVFCYFGDLGGVLGAVHARLQPGGLLAFTVEELDDASMTACDRNRGWRLGRQGRYAHSFDMIAAGVAAAGFDLQVMRREVLRTEAGAPVPGILTVVQRVRHDS